MYFNQCLIALVAAAVLPICALPAVGLNKRATSDPGKFPDLQRAAELSSAAYSGCQGSAFDVAITLQTNNAATDTQGFVGYSSSRSTIAVVMRGSTSVMDILNDIDTTLITPILSGVAFPPDAQVMLGVYSPWASVHDSIISEVRSLISRFPDYTLESTGHSLGGSLTYLSYIALAQNFPGKSITSSALAAFPIGNAAFANFGQSQAGTLFRGNNALDGVPNMYVQAPYNFVHYGIEEYSSGTAATCLRCSGERDPSCSAGNGLYSVTAGHFQSFGIALGLVGCG